MLETEEIGRIPRTCSEGGGCTPAIAPFRVAHAQVEGAALFKWGCDGEVIPVLDLGEWPWGAPQEWPLAVAVSLIAPAEPVVTRLYPELVPTETRALFKEHFTGTTVHLPELGQHFLLIYYQDVTGAAHFPVLQMDKDGQPHVLQAAGPFDLRC